MERRQLTQEEVTAFIGYLEDEERSPGTREKYLWDIRAFRAWLEDGMITKEAVAGWKTHLLESGYSPVTITSLLTAVNMLLR